MKIPQSSRFCPRSFQVGFSLIELLTVMAVLAVLATMTMSGVGSVMKGHALRGASERTWGAVANARQMAVSQRTHVALVLTDGRVEDGETEESMALMVLSAHPSGSSWTWSPESRWIKLPSGIAVAPEAGSFFTAAGTSSGTAYASIGSALPKIGGDAISDFTYIVFRPDGSVDATASTQPVVGFRRLKAGASTETETALVLSPESGRMRLVQL